MPLTDDAKAEIKAAIAIIREDRFEAYVRSRQKPADPPPKEDELIVEDPPKGTPPTGTPAPPAKETPPKETPPPKKSAYWGEILND